MRGMTQNTAEVNLASEETDVEAVKEHLHEHTTEAERQAVVDLMDLVQNGIDDDESIQEKVESIKSDLNKNMLPLKLEAEGELEDVIREASEEFEEIQNHPRGEEVIEMINVTIGYFYREDVDYKQMVRMQERAMAKDGDMSVTIPI